MTFYWIKKISFVNSTSETFAKNQAKTQKLYDRLNVTESQRDALVNNLAAFRAALEQHFQDQWAFFETTVAKGKNRLLQKLSEKRKYIKLQNQDTLTSDAASARSQIENKPAEVTFWKNLAEERGGIDYSVN